MKIYKVKLKYWVNFKLIIVFCGITFNGTEKIICDKFNGYLVININYFRYIGQ
jgi:hypothetical protein